MVRCAPRARELVEEGGRQELTSSDCRGPRPVWSWAPAVSRATAAIPVGLQDLAQEAGLHTTGADVTVGQWLDVCQDYGAQERVSLTRQTLAASSPARRPA